MMMTKKKERTEVSEASWVGVTVRDSLLRVMKMRAQLSCLTKMLKHFNSDSSMMRKAECSLKPNLTTVRILPKYMTIMGLAMMLSDTRLYILWTRVLTITT
jgi:hypothetical protein